MVLIKSSIGLLSERESLEALLMRLPENHSHRKFVERDLHRRSAGERGEKRLVKKFNEFFTEDPFHVLWNVNLAINEWKVQMDGLLLTERCAVIIESKNISGEINFIDHTEEFHRISSDGEKTVMEDPTVQLGKNIRFLERWFTTKGIKLPVDGLVVFTSKQCEFASKSKENHICKTYQMVEYLHRILREYPLVQKPSSVKKISKLLQTNQTPYKRLPLCQFYHIKAEDLKTGVFCSGCKVLAMRRDKRSWLCKQCGQRDSAAHQKALQEYFSLVACKITNQQFRSFCQIESPSTAKRILNSYDLETIGSTKARLYCLK